MSDLIANAETYTLPATESDDVTPTREPLHIILIGSPRAINLIVGILHTLRFAEPRSWSKPQVDPNSGKPMRILTKWIRSES
jgi:hypothetical protein